MTVDPIHRLALELVLSLSEHNLHHGDTFSVQIPRERITTLAAAIEQRYPNLIAKYYAGEVE